MSKKNKNQKKSKVNENALMTKLVKGILFHISSKRFLNYTELQKTLFIEGCDCLLELYKLSFFSKDNNIENLLTITDLLNLTKDFSELSEFARKSTSNYEASKNRMMKLLNKYCDNLIGDSFNFLEYCKTIASFRLMVDNLSAEKLTEDINALPKFSEIKLSVSLNQISDFIVDISNIIDSVSCFIFMDYIKPKNYLIRKFRIFKGELKIVYSSKKYINDALLSSYIENRNFKQLQSIFLKKFFSDEHCDFTLVASKVGTAYKDYLKWGEDVPDVMCIPKSFNFGIISLHADDNLDDSSEISIESDISFDLVDNFISRKKYAMPKNGCCIEIQDENSDCYKAEVMDIGDSYKFNIFLRKSIKNEYNEFIDKTTLYISKELVSYYSANMKYLIESNFMIKEAFVYHDLSPGLGGENNERNKLFVLGSNIFMILCLYFIFVDINNSNITISNINNGNSKLCKNTKNVEYKTAYIRRLPVGFNASSEAKKRALDADIVLEEGYTFVREFKSKDENMRKIKIK